MKNKLYNKILSKRIWRRLYVERMGEPLVYNVVSLFVLLFGSFRRKIFYDLVPRQPYACCIDLACQIARRYGIKKLALLEFGVAAGGGLLNMVSIADRMRQETGIEFTIAGFDTGTGMPPPLDYRDHPEQYGEGDFPMVGQGQLLAMLPPHAKLYVGDVGDCLDIFFRELPAEYAIGFISIDVDFYSSTTRALNVLLHDDASRYLPFIPMYFDDVNDLSHNEYCGERLAIQEFNQGRNAMRKITKLDQLKYWRIFSRTFWLDRIYMGQILDSTHRRAKPRKAIVLENPYLSKS